MNTAHHVIVVHHAPSVVETVALVLAANGFTVHAAATFGRAIQILENFDSRLIGVIAHADMPTEPSPGTFLDMVEMAHPQAAMVVMSGRTREQIGRLPMKSVLLREPFDRVELLDAIASAADPRMPVPAERRLLVMPPAL